MIPPDPAGLESISRRIPIPRNVQGAERTASLVGGAALLAAGMLGGTKTRAFTSVAGGALLFRGLLGYCPVKHGLLGDESEGSGQARSAVMDHDEGITVEKSVTVRRSPEELYQYWRAFENLPAIMDHLKSVEVLDDTRSHWVAKAPAGTDVEWDAEIINDVPNELIGWRSLPDSGVANAGSVHFSEAPGNRGTEVRVRLRYDPKFGRVGAGVARLFGENPEQQLAGDLRRFKQTMEAGETPTVEGQSTGR